MKPLLNVVLAAGLAAFAAASASAEYRYWSATNGTRESFNRPASWNPAPASMSEVGGDRFVLDKGLDKIAEFAAGDAVRAENLYLGYDPAGSGCLEMTGGTLTLSNFLVGHGSGFDGKTTVSGNDTMLNASVAIYVGDKGNGELTINGGTVHGQFAVQFGGDNVSGNTAVVNLNGGVLSTDQVNAHGSPIATFNWNGGVLRHSGGNVIFPANDNITINVLENGAFYESDRTESFNHPLSGDGAFTCRVNSGKTLTLAGAVDLKGGFRVESGKLKLSNLVRTKFREISVAQGCTLDLNGASVTVASYSIDGVAQPEGKYSAHNGTIRVDREAMAEYSRPEVLWTAAAWYDPSDTDALTKDANGKVTGIKNRGTVGSDLDLVRRNTGKSGAALSTDGFNGRSSLYFDNASGYVSSGYFPADLPASGPRTLFVVAQGDVSSMVMLSVAQKASGNEEGRSLLLAHGTDSTWGSAYQIGRVKDGEQKWSSGKVPFGTLSANKPYVFAGRTELGDGDGRIVSSIAFNKSGNATGSTNTTFRMPSGQQGLRFVSYYGVFEIDVSWINCDTVGYQGEALIFTNALTDAEMDEVNAYLKAKWLDSSSVEPDYPEPDDGSTDSPATRYWADSNGAEASFGAIESWDPKPKTIEGLALDKLVLNKGVDKVATIGPDDDVSVKTLYVGWGTLDDGANMSAKYDKGGRLDVTGGLLTVTDYFRLGGGYSDRSNNVVNVTGGRVVASRLRTSDCSRDGGKKCETLNVSGTGVFEIAADEALLATYSGGETFVNVTDGGTFTGDQHIDIGRAGKATFTLDGGTVSLSDGKDVNVGRNWNAGGGDGTLAIKSGSWTSGSVYVGQGSRGAATGELVISGGTVNMKRVKVGVNQGTGTFRLSNAVVNTTADSGIGIDADSTGTMVIESGKFVSAGDQFRIGEKGTGVLIMNGGELTANIALELNGNTNSAAKGTMLMLNGGKITVGQINTKTSLTTATMMWNGGVLSCNGKADGLGGIFPKSDYIKVNVLGGGAIYETAAGMESKSETIAQPLSGSGAFTKRGGGTLNLTGALDLKGGFKVEGGTLNIGRGALARTTFMELSVAKDSVLNLNGAAVWVASYTLDGVAQPEGTYNAQGGTVTVGNDENPAGRLVVDGAIDLQDGIISVESVSGSGFATNGIVAVNGDVVVSVGRTWAVDVPTFDMLALGPKARLVVKGAGNLPRDKTINILPFTTLSGRFGSVVGEGGVPVNVI